MPDKLSITLAHPAVQEAKARWEESRKKWGILCKCALTFEELFECFKTMSQIRIADLSGLSREGIRQIYNKYFRSLFDDKSGILRKRDRTLDKHRIRSREAGKKLIDNDDTLSTIAQSARKAGCVVDAFLQDYPNLVSTTKISINGNICSVHRSSNLSKCITAKRESSRLSLTRLILETTKATVIYSQVNDYKPAIFVVPTVLLLEAYFRSEEIKRTIVSLPLLMLPNYRGQKARIDWWQYEEAWHLLPFKTTVPVSK